MNRLSDLNKRENETVEEQNTRIVRFIYMVVFMLPVIIIAAVAIIGIIYE